MIIKRFPRIKIADQWANCLPGQRILRDWYKIKYNNFWVTSTQAAVADVSVSHTVFLSSLKRNNICAFVMNIHGTFHAIKSISRYFGILRIPFVSLPRDFLQNHLRKFSDFLHDVRVSKSDGVRFFKKLSCSVFSPQ